MLFPGLCRKKGCIISCLLFLFFQSRAQDYIIRHDFQKDNTTYFQIGKNRDTSVVKEINQKKPGKIILKVDNFNPFYWNAKVTVFKKPVDEESSHIGLFLAGLTKVSGAGILGDFKSGEVTPENKDKIDKLQKKVIRFSELKQQLSDLQKEIHKTEIAIKTEARQAVVEVFGKDTLSAKEVRAMGSELDKEKKEVNAAVGQVAIEYSFNDELQEILGLYHSIVYTEFKFLYSVNGNPDISELKLAAFPKSGPDTMSRDTISRYFPIEYRSTLKLRNSVGVTFTYFQDKNRSYYVKPDLTIGSGNADLFTPVMSTFINFYSNKNTGIKWGGSFGFGIPLTGEKKDLNFMLGLCTVLGRNEPIIISAGFAGTKVERLTKGWGVGQTVPSLDFEIPTLSQFRPGGFISITFNLRNLSSNKQED